MYMTKTAGTERAGTKAGIVISLEKRMPVLRDDFKESYDIVIFGHYDGMKVKTLSHWGEFRPGRVAELMGGNSLNDGIYDRYLIKACYPSSSQKAMLETEYGLCYDTWEEESPDREYPFVSCVMLHLTKDCVRENSIALICTKIAEVLKSGNCKKTMKYGIYFSIGYSDVIILARTKGIGNMNAIDQIHTLSTASGQKWISDVYTVAGYDRRLFSSKDAWSSMNHVPSMNYSVSFVLKVGFSLTTFREDLKAAMEQTFCSVGYSHDFSDFKEKVFATFGNTDVVMSLQCPERIFPALYAPDNVLGFFAPFHIHSPFYKKYVTTIKVSVLCDDDISIERLSEMDFSIPKPYTVFLEELKTLAAKKNLPQRMVSAVVQIMKSYSILIAPEHGFEVKHLIGAAMDAFINNMRISLERLDQAGGLEKSALISNIERAVGKFRDYIGTYLSDLYRSDKSFMEGRTMTHQAIGSLSKLLFAYNVFINQLTDFLQKEKTAKKPAFVLVSGGCDKTQVDEIFGYLGPWTEGYHHLFIVAIPEISLFDISGTLFRLSHECHHCFGDRKRIRRAAYTQSAWAEYIAYYFSQQLFDERFYQLASLKDSGSSHLLKLQKRICKERSEFQNQFSKLLHNYIENSAETHTENGDTDEAEYYEVNCVRHIHSSMGINFLIAKDTISPLYGETLQLLFKHQIQLLRDLIQKTTYDKKLNHRDILSELEYYRDHFDHISPFDMKDPFSGMLYRLFNSVTASEQMMMEELLMNHPKASDHKEYNQLLYTIGNFAKTSLNVMSECFADCMSAKRLGMQLSDFLLAFVYETWDIDKAMPENQTNILRMGVDLEILFNISEKSLGKELWKPVERLKENYLHAGFELKVDLKIYHHRLNDILDKYQSLRAVGDQIICYLKECGISSIPSETEPFKEFYGKFRNPNKCKARMHDFLYYWGKLAQEEGIQNTGA